MNALRGLVTVLAVAAVIMAILAFGRGGCGIPGSPAQPPPQREDFESKGSGLPPGVIAVVPLTLAVSSDGGLRPENLWWLSVNSAGEAQLWRSFEEGVKFEIPPEEWDAFRKALERERFFDLRSEYGESVPDGGSVTMTVTAGRVNHTVTLLYTNNLSQAEQKEAARAGRLVKMLLGWVESAKSEPEGPAAHAFTAEQLYAHYSRLPGTLATSRPSPEDAKAVLGRKDLASTEEMVPREWPTDSGSIRFLYEPKGHWYWAYRVNRMKPADSEWLVGPFPLPRR